MGFVGLIRGVALAGLVVATQAWAADPRLGGWTLVSAVSTVEPANKLTITSTHDAVHVVMSGETRIDFTAKWDGHDTAVPGNPGFNAVELKKIDKKQVEVTEKKNDAVVATVRLKVGPDGREMTITTANKGRAEQVAVWTRSGGAKAAGDPFAGEWTEDLGKSRMRQGTALKVEANGADGVRFTGEYSYVARFDGKAYEVKNSRNDTVTLALVDAHTVDASFKRDEQVTQKDRWVVSADGKQMTLTSTGTLETGQHVSEKLVFQKQ